MELVPPRRHFIDGPNALGQHKASLVAAEEAALAVSELPAAKRFKGEGGRNPSPADKEVVTPSYGEPDWDAIDNHLDHQISISSVPSITGSPCNPTPKTHSYIWKKHIGFYLKKYTPKFASQRFTTLEEA